VRDFNVFFLADGTAAPSPALHLASLRNIAYGFGRVLSVDEARRTVESSLAQKENNDRSVSGGD
jgi:isochorismate hydrolase